MGVSDEGFYIVGAGGFGREVYEYALDAAAAGWPFKPFGFIDNNPQALGGIDLPVRIVGGTRLLQEGAGKRYVIGLGDPDSREFFRRRIHTAGGLLLTLVHPLANIARSASLGDGCVFAPYSLAAPWAKVGANVVANVYASIGHDASIGADTVIGPYSGITGACGIGEGVLLGAGAIVSPRVRVGSGSKVSAGSVVRRDAPEGSLIAGNPAKSRVMFDTRSASPDQF